MRDNVTTSARGGLRASLGSVLAMVAMLAAGSAAAEALRPEVGKPLQAAQEFLKAKKYPEAMARVRDASNVADKTADETLTIERMRAAIAASSGDLVAAAKSYEDIVAMKALPAAEQAKMELAVASFAYQLKDWAKVISWSKLHLKGDAQAFGMVEQAYFQLGDCASLSRDIDAAAKAAGPAHPLAEDYYQMVAVCCGNKNDRPNYAVSMEKLLTAYPKPEYFVDVIAQTRTRPGFSDRLSLDVFRLRFALNLPLSKDEYMEAVQLSLQDGLFAEASALIACGYSSGTMGVGTDVERQKRLQDLVIKRAAEGKPALAQRVQDAAAAKDVPALFNLGYSYIGLGDAATGLPLMENAVRTGSFKHIEDAKLRLGEAYLLAGQRDKAVAMFKTVAGTDGTADLARLWQLVPVSKP